MELPAAIKVNDSSRNAMPRLLVHALLCFALIFQSVGAVCALAGQAGASGMPMTSADPATVATACADMKGCAGCAGDHLNAQDCMQRCSLLASIAPLSVVVFHLTLPDVLTQPLMVSLVDHHQIPPTPPPIA